MNTHKDNTAPTSNISASNGINALSSYGRNVFIAQLQRDNTIEGYITKLYILRHAFPTNVGPIELAYDNNNTYSDFQ